MNRGPSPAELDAFDWAALGALGLFIVKPVPRGFYVYIAWGEDRTRPLYIGRAVNLWRRIEQHAQWKAPWTREMVELECYSFPSADLAEMAETDAILALNPIYNVVRKENLRRRARASHVPL